MLSAAAWSTYEISRCEISRWAAWEGQSRGAPQEHHAPFGDVCTEIRDRRHAPRGHGSAVNVNEVVTGQLLGCGLPA